ncbi:MAG: 3-oxoacyl-ACP synthase, partial [Actinophytocola sp.]|nr:3-oxoacyl-ACP synthase [Actinophytocola sp.]
VVGAETLSRFADYDDKRTSVLLGDGAGAVVLTKVDSGGILRCILGADSHRGVEFGGIPGGGSRMPASAATVADGSHYLKMNSGRAIREFVAETFSDLFRRILASEGISASDLDLVVPHQANGRMIDELEKSLGLNASQVCRNVETVGNTSAASIPIALDDAVRSNRLKFWDNVLLLAVGGGGTWGATLVRWCLK